MKRREIIWDEVIHERFVKKSNEELFQLALIGTQEGSYAIDELSTRMGQNTELIQKFFSIFCDSHIDIEIRCIAYRALRNSNFNSAIISIYAQMLNFLEDGGVFDAPHSLPEGFRAGLYDSLSWYADYPDLVLPILIKALINETFTNNVLDQLVDSIICMGSAAIPYLLDLMDLVAADELTDHGPGKCILPGTKRALEKLGHNIVEIEKITIQKPKKKRFGFFNR